MFRDKTMVTSKCAMQKCEIYFLIFVRVVGKSLYKANKLQIIDWYFLIF